MEEQTITGEHQTVTGEHRVVRQRTPGRRPYDLPMWARVTQALGFPVIAFFMAWHLITGSLDKLTAAVQDNTRAITILVCKLDPPNCGRVLKP